MGIGRIFVQGRANRGFPGVVKNIFAGMGQKWLNLILPTQN